MRTGKSPYAIRVLGCLFLMGAGLVFFSEDSAASDIVFTFEENSDPLQATDSSGNEMNLPYLGKSRQSGDAAKFGKGSMAMGKDTAMGFGGSMVGSQLSDLGGPISQMTISLWVLPNSDDSDWARVFFLQRLNGSKEGGFTFSLSVAGQLVFYAGIDRGGKVESAKVTSQSTPGLMMGEWTHFAMTFDEGEVIFYYNGEPVESAQPMPDEMTSIPELVELRLGVLRALVSSPSIVNVDDFGFFSERALSPEDIAAIYEKGLAASGVSGSQP